MDVDDIQSQRVIHQPPSCIEICPSHPSFFVVGTYKLEDGEPDQSPEAGTSQSRSGRLELYEIKRKAHSSDFGISQCIDKHDYPDCAVLDLHFHPHDPTFFALCTSTSQMLFFRLEGIVQHYTEQQSEPCVRKIGSVRIGDDTSLLATSFAWNPWLRTTDNKFLSFAATFSNGGTSLFLVEQESQAIASGQHKFSITNRKGLHPEHSLEAWTVAFTNTFAGSGDEKLILTGGDDSVLSLHSITYFYDRRAFASKHVLSDRRSHAAGVTVILQIFDGHISELVGRVFATGSYDKHIRVFTTEEGISHKSEVVAELSLGGGVWRLRKLLELKSQVIGDERVSSTFLLASCMHAGVRIVRITRRQRLSVHQGAANWGIEIVGEFTEGHESMCYGADLVNVRNLLKDDDVDLPAHSSRRFVVVSTSFYDKKLCIWPFHLKDNPHDKLNPEQVIAATKRDQKKYHERRKGDIENQPRTNDDDRSMALQPRRRSPSAKHELDSVGPDQDTESWTLVDRASSFGDDEGNQCMSLASDDET
jgi:diphthine methyl ester acylhydrolase